VRFLLLIAATAACAGCEEEAPVRVRLRIAADARIPDEVDRVRVTIAASRLEEGMLCVPATREFLLRGADDLPLYVDFHPGPRYAASVAFRVEWFRGADRVNVRDLLRDLDAGAQEVEARLHAACLARYLTDNRCPPGEDQCVGQDGICSPLLDPSPFDDPTLVEPGAPSCDSGAGAS
jgi:hypothetical protein